MEIVAAMVDDGFYRQVNIRLIQIFTGTRLETLPFAGIVFVFGMYPYFRTIEPVEWRVVEQIVFDESILVVGFERVAVFGADIRRRQKYRNES